MTTSEMRRLGWKALDVIIVSGDAYVDSPHVGAALVGKALVKAGFRVGIIAQPDVKAGSDIMRLGEPLLFWGVTAGCTDSIVANYTASGRKRRSCDFTPGGVNDRRPDRATIAYSNLIRRFFKNTRPIVLGGVEASLRRVTHYDFLSGSLRRSVLFDAKADVLVYGMGETTSVALAKRFAAGGDYRDIPGICHASSEKPEGFDEMPPHDEAAANPVIFETLFKKFHKAHDQGRGLVQKIDTRWLVINPPPPPPSTSELDSFYDAGFERDAHPAYAGLGGVKALDTIRFSLATHRGCFGGCRFCAIAFHEGRTVVSRSPESLADEAARLSGLSAFTGQIRDLGGPTANMYQMGCGRASGKNCVRESCLFPSPCRFLRKSHEPLLALYEKIGGVRKVKAVTVGSGIRHDLVMADDSFGRQYLWTLAARHVSGLLKVAPEHSVEKVLRLMGKPGMESLLDFSRYFYEFCADCGKRQYLTHYFMAAHPGCTQNDMKSLAVFCRDTLKITPKQIQIFTPTPSTFSTLLFVTGKDPATGEKIFTEKSPKGRDAQKAILTGFRR